MANKSEDQEGTEKKVPSSKSKDAPAASAVTDQKPSTNKSSHASHSVRNASKTAQTIHYDTFVGGIRGSDNLARGEKISLTNEQYQSGGVQKLLKLGILVDRR